MHDPWKWMNEKRGWFKYFYFSIQLYSIFKSCEEINKMMVSQYWLIVILGFFLEFRNDLEFDLSEPLSDNSENLTEHFFVPFTPRTLVNELEQAFVFILQENHFLILKQVNLMIKNFLYRVEKFLTCRNRLDCHAYHTRVELTARVKLHLTVLEDFFEECVDLLKEILLGWFLGTEVLID